MMKYVGEQWRPVVGCEEHYLVSSLGRVWSHRSDKLMKLRLSDRGYMSVPLTVSRGQYKHARVHRLVAEAFIGPRPDGAEVNHIDFDRANNKAANLEYVTRLQNVRYSDSNGRRTSIGERHFRAKLSVGKVQELWRLKREGVAMQAIAKRLGVHPTTVQQVVYGVTWRDASSGEHTISKAERARRLTPETLAKIRNEIALGKSDRELGIQFGLHRTNIYDIRVGRTWTRGHAYV